MIPHGITGTVFQALYNLVQSLPHISGLAIGIPNVWVPTCIRGRTRWQLVRWWLVACLESWTKPKLDYCWQDHVRWYSLDFPRNQIIPTKQMFLKLSFMVPPLSWCQWDMLNHLSWWYYHVNWIVAHGPSSNLTWVQWTHCIDLCQAGSNFSYNYLEVFSQLVTPLQQKFPHFTWVVPQYHCHEECVCVWWGVGMEWTKILWYLLWLMKVSTLRIRKK